MKLYIRLITPFVIVFLSFFYIFNIESSSIKTDVTFLGPKKWAEGSLNSNGLAYVNCIKSNKNNLNEIYAGTDGGGLWKTINSGESWQCLTDNINGAGQKFDVLPSDFNTVYVTTSINAPTGTLLKNGYWGIGAYKTTNAGKSWSRINLFPENERHLLRDIKISIEDENLIYGVSQHHIFSLNQKTNKAKRLYIPYSKNGQMTEFSVVKEKEDAIYLTGIRTFVRINKALNKIENLAPLVADTTTDFRVSIDFYDNKMYAFVSEGRANKLFVSADKGKTWELLSRQSLSGVAYCMIMKVSPKDEVFAGGIYFYKEADSTKIKYKRIGSKIKMHPDIRSIEFPDVKNSNHVLVGNDGGIYRSLDGGTKWENITSNLACLKAFTIEINEDNPEIIACGTADCGTLIRHSDKKWYHVYGCDGGTCIISKNDTSKVWTMCNKNIKFSDKGGIRGSLKSTGFMKKLIFHDSPMIQDPSDNNIIYTGGWNIAKYDIENKEKIASTWFSTFNDNGTTGSTSALNISSSGEYIYFATNPMRNKSPEYVTLWRSSNDLKSYKKNIGRKLKFLKDENTQISDIDVHRDKPLSVWFCTGKFSEHNKVFFSQNGGISWQNLSYNLDDVPVNCISHYSAKNDLYIGTDIGLFVLKNNSNKWKIIDNIPRVIISDMKVNNKTGELYFSTYGRGIWKLKL